MSHWQPTLQGSLIMLRPLAVADYEPLFQAAADPLIWEQHPDHLRYTRERFDVYFQSGLASQGALVILEERSGAIIGSSRYTGFDAATSSIEVGYTFLTRAYWGRGFNHELKALMLDHAFQAVDDVFFYVGETNFRSQMAMKKIGGIEVRRERSADRTGGDVSVVFRIAKRDWPSA